MNCFFFLCFVFVFVLFFVIWKRNRRNRHYIRTKHITEKSGFKNSLRMQIDDKLGLGNCRFFFLNISNFFPKYLENVLNISKIFGFIS